MKSKSVFYCTSCGNETPRWQGQCPACGAWNTMEEAPVQPAAPKGAARKAAVGPRPVPKRLNAPASFRRQFLIEIPKAF